MFLGLLPIWLVIGWYEWGFWQSLVGNGHRRDAPSIDPGGP